MYQVRAVSHSNGRGALTNPSFPKCDTVVALRYIHKITPRCDRYNTPLKIGPGCWEKQAGRGRATEKPRRRNRAAKAGWWV
jgi:hypothetical protein